MTQVNLLPWREQARQIKKIRFFILLGMAIGLAILLIVMLHLFISGIIASQESINAYLDDQLSQEKSAVTRLIKQKKEKEKTLSQLKFAYSLQKQSIKAVNLLNILANNIPDGITLTKINREGNKITLIGKSQSTLGVTAFMSNIEKTNQFNQPVLTKISGNDKNEEKTGNQDLFQIEVVQKE